MKPRTSNPGHDEEQPSLAVLIDADNAQPGVIEGLLAEVAKYGVASVKRIYGDFTAPQLGQWKKELLKHSISPVQQFAYTSGKNATDSALIIDAMDLLYTRRFDGFCLVSSDSDFTRLAQRLREEGLTVYGFGQRKTPDAFVKACDKFIYTDIFSTRTATPPRTGERAKAPTRRKEADPAVKTTPGVAHKAVAHAGSVATPKAAPPANAPVDLIRQAIEEGSDENGWAHLGGVGKYLNKIRPDFDPRHYGQKKLSDLVRQLPRDFELDERVMPGNSGRALYVRSVV